MVPTIFLLDGDAARRLIKRRLRRNPDPGDIERYCRSVLRPDEELVKIYYYDCAPFGEVRPRPISNAPTDFSKDLVFKLATRFQDAVRTHPLFKLRRGHLSFDGWTITANAIQSLMNQPRSLTDSDFRPLLSQKQVDLMIALDIARIAAQGRIPQLGMITCDSDFIPIIEYAKSKGLIVFLVLDDTSIMKKQLRAVFSSRRYG